MAINYPGPYEVRVQYTALPASGLKAHEFRFSCSLTTTPVPGVDPTTLNAHQRGGGNTNLVQKVEDLVTFCAELYPATGDFNTAELWEYDPGTFNATWIATWTLGIPGTSGSPIIEDSQTIFTFRTTAGGIVKLDLRNTIHSSIATVPFPTSNSDWNDIGAEFSDEFTIVLGRDGGFAVVPLNALAGTNERDFKKRLRP